MDRTLWILTRQAAAADGGAEAPDEMALAAYLEGTLDDPAAETVAAWLATEPGALDHLMAIKEALDDDAGPAPERVVRRAIAVLPERRVTAGYLPALVLGLWTPIAWSGVAAALMLACGLAFQLGQSAYANTLAVEHYLSQEAGLVVNEASGDLL